MKDVLGAGDKAHGSGTKLSGYVESPVAKKCGTCEYLVSGNLCKQKVVLKDSQVPNARKGKLKKVNPETGCCDFWRPEPGKKAKYG